MCVIIHQPKDNRQVTFEEFQSSWQSNPHGFGLMYFHNGSVRIEKSMKMMDAWDIYSNLSKELEWETDFVLHFRWSTHWTIGLANTHPFHCGNGKYLVHNGVLGYSSDKVGEEDFSDTRLLALTLEKIEKGLDSNWLESDIVCDFVNSTCTWDKILVMDTNGKVYYFGDKWVMSPCGQLWASNDSPFDMYGSHCTYGKSKVDIDEDNEFDTRQGFFEDGVWVTNEDYCIRNGIPYNEADWR